MDTKMRTIPNSISILSALTGLIEFSPVRRWGLLLGLPILLSATLRGGGIGGGDIKLTASSGFVLGFPCGLVGLTVGLMLLTYHFMCRGASKSYPLAPFLTFGLATTSLLL